MDMKIYDETLKVILNRAMENKELITCDRCGVTTLAEEMHGSVCNDCANELIEIGMKVELEQQELQHEMEQAYDSLIRLGFPIGAIDLDMFLGEK